MFQNQSQPYLGYLEGLNSPTLWRNVDEFHQVALNLQLNSRLLVLIIKTLVLKI